jgi:hypothetical protein
MSRLQRRIDHHHKLTQRFMGNQTVFRPLGDPQNDFPLTGINDNRFVEVEGVEAIHPISGAIISLIQEEINRDPDSGLGDQLVINNEVYNIIKFMPDGHDDGKLVLHKV